MSRCELWPSRILSPIALSVLVACSHPTAEDNAENRARAAERYLQVSPVSQLVDEVMLPLVNSIPAEQRAQFKVQLGERFRANVLEEAMRTALIKTFTTRELEALSAFYGSPDGRGASRKFSRFLEEIQPVLRQEITRAAAEVMKRPAESAREPGQ